MNYTCNLQKKLPNTNPLIYDLIYNMLQFAPEKRLSLGELLKNTIFDSIRNPLEEIEADFKIQCPNNFSSNKEA